jgi:hypothetical protein
MTSTVSHAVDSRSSRVIAAVPLARLTIDAHVRAGCELVFVTRHTELVQVRVQCGHALWQQLRRARIATCSRPIARALKAARRLRAARRSLR